MSKIAQKVGKFCNPNMDPRKIWVFSGLWNSGNSINHQGREGGTFCVLSRVASQLKTYNSQIEQKIVLLDEGA